jgi:hypothetical protein
MTMATQLPGRVRPYLRALIAKATADCDGPEEQHISFLTAIENNLVCPFRARVAGEEVEVVGLEWPTSGYGLGAVCRSGGRDQVVDVAALEWVEPLPDGHEWIEAYLAWRPGQA